MNYRLCIGCKEQMPNDSFRKGKDVCVWCEYSKMEKRAKARHADKKRKATKWPITISKDEFVEWYLSQKDECSYCGLKFSQLKQLKLKHYGGYYVSWDIDRVDSTRPYEIGNLALSCFLCNTAKSNYLSGSEAKIVGAAMRKILNARLKCIPSAKTQSSL
jgi:hypothetical protein